MPSSFGTLRQHGRPTDCARLLRNKIAMDISWEALLPYVIALTVLGMGFALINFYVTSIDHELSDDDLKKIPVNPFWRGLTSVGSALSALVSTATENPSVTTIVACFVPAVMYIILGVVFSVLILYGVMVQIGQHLVCNAVLDFRMMSRAGATFAEILAHVLAIASKMPIAVAFHAITSPLMIVGIIGMIGKYGNLGTVADDDENRGLLYNHGQGDKPPTYDEAVRGAIVSTTADGDRVPVNFCDQNIGNTLNEMIKCIGDTCNQPYLLIPNIILIVVNIMLLAIWIILYPIGILIVMTTVLWKLIEAEYGELLECYRLTETPAIMLSIAALLLMLIPVSWPTVPLLLIAFFIPRTFRHFADVVDVPHMRGMLWMLYMELVLMQLPVMIIKYRDPTVSGIDKRLALANFILVIIASSMYFIVSAVGSPNIVVSVIITGLADIITGSLLILHFVGDGASAGEFALPTRIMISISISIQAIIITGVFCSRL